MITTRSSSNAANQPPLPRDLDRILLDRIPLDSQSHVFGEPDSRPGIAGSAYDTAWLAGVPSPSPRQDQRTSRFPAALQWLVDHQLPDGSWGGAVRYEHDRLLCTLAALAPLAAFGSRKTDQACVAAGTRYLWQHGHLLAAEPTELVGFELLLPALIQRAQRAGVAVPPDLDIYEVQRAEKLRLIPEGSLYSPRTTVVHSLEFLGDDADSAGLKAAQGVNGGLGNSPAATAFFLSRTNDPRALAYLRRCLARSGDPAAPVLHPCETFELLWSAYHLFLAGVRSARLLDPTERAALRQALCAGGVSLSPTFPIADADDTAVALLLLHDQGEAVDPAVLQAFTLPGGHFAGFPHERHASVGVNVHVLHALLRVPGYPDQERTVACLLDFLVSQQLHGVYWLDKWHISPYYATAHTLCVLSELPPGRAAAMRPVVERSREWLRQTQNSDGSWGFYGRSTIEETAYAVLALATGGPAQTRPGDWQRCANGMRSLEVALDPSRRGADQMLPPLWIDKCLYTPTLVVRAAIEAARIAFERVTLLVAPGDRSGNGIGGGAVRSRSASGLTRRASEGSNK